MKDVYIRSTSLNSSEADFMDTLGAIYGSECPVLLPLKKLCYDRPVGGEGRCRTFLVCLRLMENFLSAIFNVSLDYEAFERLKSTYLTLIDILGMVTQLVRGYEMMVRAGFIHGDIHKANIMCAKDPQRPSGLRYCHIDLESMTRSSEADLIAKDFHRLADFLSKTFLGSHQIDVVSRYLRDLSDLIQRMENCEVRFDVAHAQLLQVYAVYFRIAQENPEVKVAHTIPASEHAEVTREADVLALFCLGCRGDLADILSQIFHISPLHTSERDETRN